MTQSQWHKLEVILNQALRVVTGLPRYTPLNQLRTQFRANTLQETVQEGARLHLEELQHSGQERQILELIDTRTNALPNPTPKKRECQVGQHPQRVHKYHDPQKPLAVYAHAASVTQPEPECLVAVATPPPPLGSPWQRPSTAAHHFKLKSLQSHNSPWRPFLKIKFDQPTFTSLLIAP